MCGLFDPIIAFLGIYPLQMYIYIKMCVKEPLSVGVNIEHEISHNTWLAKMQCEGS